MVSTLKVCELINKRKSYATELKRVATYCYNCKYTSKKLGLSKRCDNCKNKLNKGKVKGTPPDFK